MPVHNINFVPEVVEARRLEGMNMELAVEKLVVEVLKGSINGTVCFL